jgi:23S rRNA (uracil1939-C5)-methyltransferase
MPFPSEIVTPEALLSRGEAVVRDRKKPLVVWGGIPGEEVSVAIFREGQHQDVGFVEHPVDQPSAHRVEPRCGKYDKCGGCPWMHLSPEAQGDARLDLVREAFVAHGLEASFAKGIIGSPDGDFDYRHTTKLVVDTTDRGNLRIGVFKRGSHRVVPIPDCEVITPGLRHAVTVVAHQIRALDIRPGVVDRDTGRNEGLLRHIVIRQSRTSGLIHVTLVVTHTPPILDELAEAITGENGQIIGVAAHVNKLPGNAIHDPQGGFRRLNGAPLITEELAGETLMVGVGDFFQANPSVADKMIRDVVTLLEPHRARPVVDLYCGVGAFTLPLARAHGTAMGVEVSEGAIRRAKGNAHNAKLDARFLAGPVLEHMDAVIAHMGGRAPVVLVDPARRGLEEGVMDRIVELAPTALVYVACSPWAMARDLAPLIEAGWSLPHLQAYDMFPQTSHVETVAMLLPPSTPEPTRRAPRRKVVR